jgi:hypothetical protein
MQRFTTHLLRSRASSFRGLVHQRGFQTTRVAASAGIVQHRDIPQNNDSTPFEWTAESRKKIAWWLRKYPTNYKQSGVIPLLYIAQEQVRFAPSRFCNHFFLVACARQEGAGNWLTLNAMRAIGACASPVFSVCVFVF